VLGVFGVLGGEKMKPVLVLICLATLVRVV
jgi:hypothetical protein